MRIRKYENYEEYLEAQRLVTAMKTKNGRDSMTWVSEAMLKVINEMVLSLISDVKTILCHGCRCGFEVDIFKRLNPGVQVFGTDLYGLAYKFDRVDFREMDFDFVPKEWEENFDLIYSNSIDHSRDPIKTLLAWKSELRKGGVMSITFQFSDRRMTKSDCFSLSLSNYESEIKDFAKEIEMEIKHISERGMYSSRGGYYADVLFLKGIA